MIANAGRQGKIRGVLTPCLTALAGLFISGSIANADTCSPVPVDNTNNCGWFNVCTAQSGGQDLAFGGPLWPQTAQSTISLFNPSPVYGAVSVWSALENQTSKLIAQIGYIHAAGVSNNDVGFAQWTDNNGTYSQIKYLAAPTGTDNYSVYRQGNGTFDLEDYHSIVLPPSSVNWGPNATEYKGEMDTLFNGQGDHTMGNKTSPVSFTNTFWSDQYGSRHTESLYYLAANKDSTGTAPFMNLYSWDSAQFEIWDSRCA